MSLTLEDFLRITSERDIAMKKQRDLDLIEQAKQRTEDESIRARERKEHLDAISKLIESGVKSEVRKFIDPLQKQNDERMHKIESELCDLRNLLHSNPLATSSQSRGNTVRVDHSPPASASGVSSAINSSVSTSSEIVNAVSKARRTISLKPIYKKDVDLQYRSNKDIVSEHDAMVAAVSDYLFYELKYRNSVPNIVRVFPPANSSDFDRLYVEFESEYDADYISSFSRFIRKPDHQVSIYVPRGFQQRFRAFNL